MPAPLPKQEVAFRKAAMPLAVTTALLLGLPLLGARLAGRPLAPLLELPPRPAAMEQQPPFSWPVFIAMALLVLAVCIPFARRILGVPVGRRPGRHFPFPAWGWLGPALIMIAWPLAWSRQPWFAPLQPYTFLPLWLGYIGTMNALTVRRSGSCPLTARPRFFAALFPLSALFWWYFEYLNRFVANWYYRGVEHFSAAHYVVHASLAFATVLPAVISTRAWLATMPRLTAPLADFLPLAIAPGRRGGALLTATATAGLIGIGSWPQQLFPLVWIAPLLLLLGLEALAGRRTLLAAPQAGDWRPIWLPALAALICGLFWELWNFKSFAHWEYAVPYVGRFHLFAMPLIGYAGYLPFGLECAVAADLLQPTAGRGDDDEL